MLWNDDNQDQTDDNCLVITIDLTGAPDDMPTDMEIMEVVIEFLNSRMPQES